MPKEKDGYKICMIVPKPTDPEELKKREELSKRLEELPNEELRKALEGIQAKKEQEERERKEREKKEEEERKAREVPQEIKNFRKTLEGYLGDETKNKIIESTNRITPKIKIEPDGSRMIEMKIGGKEYKLLVVNTETHTDRGYGAYFLSFGMTIHEVNLGGMRGDNVDNWKNQKLKEYVKERQRERFHIPKIEEMRSFLNELGKEAEIAKEEDQIAMLMYLTSMCGYCWLTMGDDEESDSQANSRSFLVCSSSDRGFGCNAIDYQYGGLCMFACN